MSLLIRAALLGGLAYVVSRAARKRQQSIDSSRSEARRLAGATEDNRDEQWSTQSQPSIPHV
jgi:hypothetical protein